jgi:hypothetical protein
MVPVIVAKLPQAHAENKFTTSARLSKTDKRRIYTIWAGNIQQVSRRHHYRPPWPFPLLVLVMQPNLFFSGYGRVGHGE